MGRQNDKYIYIYKNLIYMLADRPHTCKKKIEEICIPIVEITE